MYFVTICCQSRSANQLCRESVADVLFETARRYHVSEQCYFCLLLLMPDHLHGLISIGGDIELANLIRNFKRITARLDRAPDAPSKRAPRISHEVDGFILRLLARNRDERWPDARSAATELRNLIKTIR